MYDNGSRGVECRCKKSPSDAVNQSLWILLSSAGNWWTEIGRGSYEWKKGLNYRDKACSEEACNLVAFFVCRDGNDRFWVKAKRDFMTFACCSSIRTEKESMEDQYLVSKTFNLVF